jgi:hypothetical protein
MKQKFISLLLLITTFAFLNIFTRIQPFTYAGAINGYAANSTEKEIRYPYDETGLLTIQAISIFNVPLVKE